MFAVPPFLFIGLPWLHFGVVGRIIFIAVKYRTAMNGNSDTSHNNETPSIQLAELQQQDMKRQFEENQARIQTLQEPLPVESPGSASETSSQEASGDPAKQQEIIFVSRERKIKHFTGLSASPTSRVEDFIEDVRGVAASREMNPQQQVHFIMSNLDGPAKEDIRLLDSDVQKNPELVFTALQEAFGERRSLPQLLRLFYERHQRENESLRGYSHALSDIIGHILKNLKFSSGPTTS